MTTNVSAFRKSRKTDNTSEYVNGKQQIKLLAKLHWKNLVHITYQNLATGNRVRQSRPAIGVIQFCTSLLSSVLFGTVFFFAFLTTFLIFPLPLLRVLKLLSSNRDHRFCAPLRSTSDDRSCSTVKYHYILINSSHLYKS